MINLKQLFIVFVSACFFQVPGAFSETIKINEKKVDVSPLIKYDEAVSFTAGQELQFKDFKLTFLEEVDPEANSTVKSSASIRHHYYLVKDSRGEQKISVTSGQLPPPNKEFTVSAGTFLLHTWQTPSGQRLFPSKLLVSKKQ